ncbi:hypothetical protein B6U66_02385 [Candidatus Bathyarchaeota archaeon ex4484_135]|nr:MAG: hypothetical protein B6U66_02385 [Candidatus Bathyarchaeota archaeon ex4484_135]
MSGLADKLRALRNDLSVLRGNFLVLMVTWVLWRFAFRMVMPYGSLYIRALGATPTVLGLMNSVYMAFFCLSLIPGSYVADAWGRRRIIVIMTYALSLSYLFYVIAPSWQLILVGMCVEALSRVYSPALQAITADSLPPERRGIGYAMTRVLPDLFAVASPLVAVFLIEHYGFLSGLRIAYISVILAGLTAATIRLLFLKETIRPSPPTKKGLISIYSESLREVVRTLREAPRSLKAIIFVPLLSYPFMNALWTFIPLFVVDYSGISEGEWGLMASIRMGFGLATGLLLGKLADKLSKKKLIVASCLMRALVFTSLALVSGFLPVLAALLALELALGLSMPSFSALTADLTPREMRGRVIGANMLVSTLASIPTPFLVGFIYEHVSPCLVFYLTSGLFVLVALLLAALVEEPEKKEV